MTNNSSSEIRNQTITPEMISDANQHQKYIDDYVVPILEELLTELLVDHPSDPVKFMIRHLCRKSGNDDPTSSPCTPIRDKSVRNVSWDESRFEVKTQEREIYLASEVEKLQTEIRKLKAKINHLEMQHNPSNQYDSMPSDPSDGISESTETDNEEDIPDVMEMEPKGFNKKSRCSVSAEAYGAWNKRSAVELPVIFKSADQIKRIETVLQQSFLFSSLDQKDLKRVIEAMEEKVVDAKTCVIRQGDDAEALYVVEEGELDCIKIHENAGNDGTTEELLKTCYSGDAFGELALLYNCPRAASVKSRMRCVLWQLDRESFNHIVKDAAQKKRELYDHFLRNVPILESMNEYEREKVADALKAETFQDGEYIVRQGDQGEKFYFIEEGVAVATKSYVTGHIPLEVMTYEAGNYFGELSLLKNQSRAANVIAKGVVKTVSLDRRSFKRLLGPLQELLTRRAENYN